MKRIIPRGSGFLRRSKTSRNAPTISIYKPGRLRHPPKSDKPVGGR